MRSNRQCDERGAVFALGAAALTAILMVAALVIDLGATRAQRATDQVSTDAAAAAGVVGLVDGGGEAACNSALGYLEVHMGGPVSGIGCSGFPALCNDLTAAVRSVGTVDDKTVTIVYPVPDSDPTMESSALGANAQPATLADGHPCDRVGVEISSPIRTFFSSIASEREGSTTVHSVARVSNEYGRNLIVNLLLLERHECEALTIGGGGSSGGIIVSSVTDPATGDVYPGRISIDSDGTTNCESRGTIHGNGSGSTIRADGEPGCADELAPAGLGLGCGRIETYAAGAPGCNLPACTTGGTIAPGPTTNPRQLTRAPVDWRYNCKSNYPVSYDIRRCPDAGITSSYIDDLVFAVNSYAPFQSYTAAGYPCQINGGPTTSVVVPEGNWLIDCPELKIQRALTFEGGNLVFEGDITLGADGNLRVNTNNTDLYSWTPGSALAEQEHSPNAAWVYMQDGTISKSGSGSIEFANTMVYMSSTSGLSLSGGAGSMLWSAPTVGPFQDLALWSESAANHRFSGSAALQLEGIFFTPLATIVYTGNGGQASVAAQFIANKAEVQGNGSIAIAPKYDRSIKHEPPAISELVR